MFSVLGTVKFCIFRDSSCSKGCLSGGDDDRGVLKSIWKFVALHLFIFCYVLMQCCSFLK
jgi:hypothetical protein